jgi:hypothetical protein
MSRLSSLLVVTLPTANVQTHTTGQLPPLQHVLGPVLGVCALLPLGFCAGLSTQRRAQ